MVISFMVISFMVTLENSWKLSKYWPKLANVYKQSSNFSSNYQKFQLIFPKYLQTKCQITPVTWVIFTLWIKILANLVHSWKHLPHIKGSQFDQFLSPDPRQRQTTTPNFSNYGNWIHIIIHICNIYDCMFAQIICQRFCQWYSRVQLKYSIIIWEEVILFHLTSTPLSTLPNRRL